MDLLSALPSESIYVLSGISVHLLYFVHGEHHLHPLTPVKAYSCLLLTAIGYGVLLGAGSWTSYLNYIVRSFLLHLLGLYSSIIIYRLFFHRLRHFPGPVAARISMGWLLLHNIRRQQGYLKLTSLREKYGNFVRIGPNKLVVFDGSILQAMENPANGCTKTDWYDCGHPTTGINMFRQASLHDARRKVWANAFGPQSMSHFDTVINLYAQKFVRVLGRFEKKPLNLTHYFNLLTFDIIGELGFSEAFGTLESGTEHKVETVVAEFMQTLGAISAMPWLCRLFTDIPGLLSPWTGFLEWCRSLILRRIESKADHPDIASAWISHSREAGTLEQDILLLRGDAQTLIVAGSDTVASVLTNLFYHLCREPEHQSKIRAELSEAPNRFDAKVLQQCTHLNAVIDETMRLNSPLPTGGERFTGPNGLSINGTFIPPNVAILPTRWAIGRLEDCFEKADTFLPERWYSQSKLRHEKRAHLPFGEGKYGCIGRTLGLMEIRCIVATFLYSYTVRFAGEENQHCVVEDMRDHVTAAPGRLDVVFEHITS